MNKLEEFIKSNREEIDDATPSAEVWQNVEVAISEKKKKVFILSPWYKWSAAAAILLMVALGGYYIAKKNNDQGKLAVAKIDTIDYASVPDDSTVGPIVVMVAQRQQELKTLTKDQPELYQKFTTDITQLDSSYKNLRKQFNTSPNREVLIEAMIQNLQLQLNVLNQQLNIIHQIKQSKNYSHEKIDQHI